jgi:tetratricopeptide (TPR) repeat protein
VNLFSFFHRFKGTLVLLRDMYKEYGFFKKALNDYQKVAKVCGNLKRLQKFKADSYWGIGDIERLMGKYEESLQNLKKAKSISERNAWHDGISDALWTEGYVYICVARYVEAEKAFKQIFNLYRQAKVDEAHKDSTKGALGDVYRLTGRFEESLKLYKEAEESMHIQGNDSGRAWILTVMGHSYLQLNQPVQAKRVLLKAENLARRIGDEISLIWALQARAELERGEKKYKEAESYYLESMELAHSHGLKLEVAHSYLGLAEISRRKGRRDPDLYEKPLKIYKRIGSPWGINECCLRENILRNEMSPSQDRPLNFP